MAAILTTKEDAQGVEGNIDPKNFHLWEQPTPNLSQCLSLSLSNLWIQPKNYQGLNFTKSWVL